MGQARCTTLHRRVLALDPLQDSIGAPDEERLLRRIRTFPVSRGPLLLALAHSRPRLATRPVADFVREDEAVGIHLLAGPCQQYPLQLIPIHGQTVTDPGRDSRAGSDPEPRRPGAVDDRLCRNRARSRRRD